jgi:nucleoside-triphosphatase
MTGDEETGECAFLLTGPPGCGKTTAIRRTVAQLDIPAGGFYTQEIREAGRRKGFRIMTLDGREGVLAHVDIPGSPRVSKYGVDLAALDSIGVGAVRAAIEEGMLIVIDEIGPMEMRSAAFRQVVRDALNSGLLILGSIVGRSSPFSDEVKGHPAVRLIELNRENRQKSAAHLLAVLTSAARRQNQGLL